MISRIAFVPLALAGLGAGCGGASVGGKTPGETPKAPADESAWADPEADYPPSADPEFVHRASPINRDAPLIAITGGTVMTATGEIFQRGTVILEDGLIRYAGEATAAPEGAQVIDATGRYVTPGIIDTHSHIGVYAAPNVAAHSDGNEAVAATTAHARAAYGYHPQDPAITRATAGGVTAAQILPGSANLIGGRGVTVAMLPGNHVDDVRFPNSPATIKMACGENPKRVYGEKGGPQTRMGEYAVFRQTFQQAAEYRAKWTAYHRARKAWLKKRNWARDQVAHGKQPDAEKAPEPPPRDFGMETLAGVLSGDVLVQIHCYRGDEIREMIAIADQYGFKIRSFHHGLEAYKVRDILAKKDIAVSTWADWWGFKMEAFDGIPENAALLHQAGARAIIHSDSSIGIQRLNQEAAKAMYSGQAAGIPITESEALRWITMNPAWALGIDAVTGSLEAGKRADVVVWSGNPFSVYAKADVVVAGGLISYQRKNGLTPTDFELGNSAIDEGVLQ